MAKTTIGFRGQIPAVDNEKPVRKIDQGRRPECVV